MNKKSEYLACNVCGVPIKEGEEHISLAAHREAYEEGALSVYESACLAVWHKKCAPIKLK